MKLELLSKDAAFLVGFAKNKLKQLKELRIKTQQQILKKNISVGVFNVYIETASWGDKIRLSGGEFKADLLYATGDLISDPFHSDYIDPYYLNIIQFNYSGNKVKTTEKLIQKIKAPSPEVFDVGYMFKLYEAKTENGFKYFLFDTVDGFHEYVRTVTIEKDRIVIGQRNETEMPKYWPYDEGNTESGLPWVMSNPEQFPQTVVSAGDEVNTSVSSYANYKSINTGAPEESVVVSWAVFSSASNISGPYEVKKTFLPTMLKNFGGRIEGPEDEILETWETQDAWAVADLGDLTREAGFLTTVTGRYFYAIIHGALGSYNGNYRFLYDIYKTNIDSGDTTIYGTYSLSDLTNTAWNKAAIVKNYSQAKEFFAYTVLSEDDVMFLFFNHNANPSECIGLSIDIQNITGTKRPVGNQIYAEAICMCMNQSSSIESVDLEEREFVTNEYYLFYLNPDHNYKGAIAKITTVFDTLYPTNTSIDIVPLFVTLDDYSITRVGAISKDRNIFSVVVKQHSTGVENILVYNIADKTIKNAMQVTDKFINGVLL